jgi:hypothetical protein
MMNGLHAGSASSIAQTAKGYKGIAVNNLLGQGRAFAFTIGGKRCIIR